MHMSSLPTKTRCGALAIHTLSGTLDKLSSATRKQPSACILDALIGVGMVVAAAGCVQQRDTGEEDRAPSAAAEAAFSPIGVERVIPLRIVQTFPLTDAQQRTHLANLQRGVDSANGVFHTAGVQFYIKVFKVCATGPTYSLRSPTAPASLAWADVQADITCALPAVSGTPSVGPKTARGWMDWTTLEYGDPSEIVVWLRDDAGAGHDARTRRPTTRRTARTPGARTS